MKKIIYAGIITSAVSIMGCATTTGFEPRVSHNEADGSRVVSIVPHAACTTAVEGCPLSVGVSWSSKLPDDAVINITLSGQGASLKELQIDIDGSKVLLHADPSVKADSASQSKSSSQSFATKLSVVKYIVESKSTSIRVVTTDGHAIEAPIVDAGHGTYAFNALKRFLHRV